MSAAQGGAAHPQPPVGAGAPAPRKRPPRQVPGVVDSGAMAKTRVSARTTASWLAAPPSAPRCPRTAGHGLRASPRDASVVTMAPAGRERWAPRGAHATTLVRGVRSAVDQKTIRISPCPALLEACLGKEGLRDPSAASLGCKTDKGPWRSFSCDETALGLSREPRLLRRDLSDFACH